MADKMINPNIVLKRKMVELGEQKTNLIRKELRLLELAEETADANAAIGVYKTRISDLEKEIELIKQSTAAKEQ